MDSHTRLELTWVGKRQPRSIEPRILLEDSANSYHAKVRFSDEDRFDNLLIHGDNLLALRALEADFTGKIRCIYIDPPYNTGAAFAQYDDGIEHSLWLSLIRERLLILHRLLSQDGSIWISVDDHESHYLKVLCDEIFGRASFVSNVIWQKKYTVANDARWLSDNHDHILVYCKDPATWLPYKLPRPDEMNAAYKNPDNHPKGPWKATPLHAKSGSAKAERFVYTFRNGVTWSPPPGTYPRFSKESLDRMDANNEIWFGKKGDSTPARKTFLSELGSDGVTALTIWTHEEVGHNHEAKEEVKAFNPKDVFATPKPERLLHRILTLATQPGDWVLDSFAGSGTTGAVAHKMGRKWIMVEQGEHVHTHILPRMKAVIDGADKGGITTLAGWNGGGGLRFFALAPSLLEKDRWGNLVISETYRRGPDAGARLAEALCKLEGFRYAPSSTTFWQHGQSTERDFIYVTTQTLNQEQLQVIAAEVGPDSSLLICCSAWKAEVSAFPNLTLKKIPAAILSRCQWGQDDYSLQLSQLSKAPKVEVIPLPPPLPEPGQSMSLFTTLEIKSA